MLHRLLIQLWKFSKNSSQTVDLMKCYLEANGSHVFLWITLQGITHPESDAAHETELAMDSWSCVFTVALRSCSSFYSQNILPNLTSAHFSSSDFSQRKTNKRQIKGAILKVPVFRGWGGGRNESRKAGGASLESFLPKVVSAECHSHSLQGFLYHKRWEHVTNVITSETLFAVPSPSRIWTQHRRI